MQYLIEMHNTKAELRGHFRHKSHIEDKLYHNILERILQSLADPLGEIRIRVDSETMRGRQ